MEKIELKQFKKDLNNFHRYEELYGVAEAKRRMLAETTLASVREYVRNYHPDAVRLVTQRQAMNN